MASLQILHGPGSGTRFALPNEHTVIGRTPGCDVRVPLTYLNRYHVQVVRRGSRFVLQDLDTRSGTRVNGRRICGLVPLRDGDRFGIGDFEVGFEFPAQPLTDSEWETSS